MEKRPERQPAETNGPTCRRRGTPWKAPGPSPIVEGARDLLFDSLGAPRAMPTDGQAYCIASLLDMEAERLRDAVRLLTGCIEARKA